MGAAAPRIVDLRIEDGRILPLGVRSLPPQIRVAADDLRREAAGDAAVGRETRQAELIERARRAEARRILAGLRRRVAESRFEQRGSADPGRAEDELRVAR